MVTHMRALVVILAVHLVSASVVESDHHAEEMSCEPSGANGGKREAALLQIGSQMSTPTKDHHDKQEVKGSKKSEVAHQMRSTGEAESAGQKSPLQKAMEGLVKEIVKEVELQESSHTILKQSNDEHRRKASGAKLRDGEVLVHDAMSTATEDQHDKHEEARAKKAEARPHHNPNTKGTTVAGQKTPLHKPKEVKLQELGHAAPKQSSDGHRQEASGTQQRNSEHVVHDSTSTPTKDHHYKHEVKAKKAEAVPQHNRGIEQKSSIQKIKEVQLRESDYTAPSTDGHRQETSDARGTSSKIVSHESVKQRKKKVKSEGLKRVSLIAKQSPKQSRTKEASVSNVSSPMAKRSAKQNHTLEASVSNVSLIDIQSYIDGIVWKMIVPDPWVCDLILGGDRRRDTCGLEPGAQILDPKQLNCGMQNTCTVEHANAFRTLYPVGSLPCCSTPPFCAAPVCKSSLLDIGVQQHSTKVDTATCTKRAPEENVAFMKLPQMWPVYHGFGGAFELDLLKFFDLLEEEKPFDLAFDLGANYGYYTEKLSVRNFAKNYVMIEANPTVVDVLRTRWENNDWLTSWYTRHGQLKEGVQMPAFQVIGQALSNDTGMLDMCKTEASFYNQAACQAPINTIDNLVPMYLTPAFQKHFNEATSAFIKVDTEGMDELVLRGMEKLLKQTRGFYKDGGPRYLVNFLQFEFSPQLSKDARVREGFQDYSIKTATQFMELMGFETFLIGPRYLPMSHGSWHEDYKDWPDDVHNNAGHLSNYPGFGPTLFYACYTQDCTGNGNVAVPSFTSDVFAIRASHPRSAEIKLALGACKESKDFDIKDPMYATATI